MKDREEIIARIKETLGGKAVSFSQPKPNRFYVRMNREDIPKAVRLIFEELSARYVIVSGVDTPSGMELLYHFSFDEADLVATVKVLLDKECPKIESITPIVRGAEWIEREIHELLGVEFAGHPNMRRLILAEDWPEGVYPLRRSYNSSPQGRSVPTRLPPRRTVEK